MSAVMPYEPWEPDFSFSDVGPQSDGTNISSGTSLPSQPADTGGGATFNYGQAVLDIFKFGVGAYTASAQRKDLLEYKRFETTAAGTFQQGRGTLLPANSTGGMSGLTLLIIAGLVVFAVSHKG